MPRAGKRKDTWKDIMGKHQREVLGKGARKGYDGKTLDEERAHGSTHKET